MISAPDREILRDLAQRVAQMASLPVMSDRRRMWEKHNALQRVRPMVLVFPEGSWRELLPPSALRCEGEGAREMEENLRRRIYAHEHILDDTIVEKTWIVPKRVTNSGWGLEASYISSEQETGSWGFDPVIADADDLAKLRFPKVTYDVEGTQADLAEATELFGDILDVELRGVGHISFHLSSLYARLRGLEQVMWDMHDHPGMLHDAMAFLEEGHRRLVKQYAEMDLLSLNNDGTYHSSGGVGYTTELPQADADGQVRPCDMWASAESQEMAQVSPQMHAEFIMQYERRLLEPFGLNGYGCCEDLTNKLDDVLAIPNMRRVSISPWANVDSCAEQLGDRAIFSWKPHPAQLVGQFDEERIRDYIRYNLEVTGGCVVEMILKDTHTCEHKPERFTRWTSMAQELVAGY